MVSLWGSKKNDDQNDQNGSGSATPRAAEDGRGSGPRYRDPDERTQLLPSQPRGPPNRDGYLDPDDPAVSPYNLWTVRFLRYLTVLFLVITFLWWVLLFISIFVSVPYLNTRGSGFFDFGFTSLTIGNLLVALLFFSNPSKAERIATGIIAIILAVDMIMILVIGQLRLEEGWVGIASVVWAFLIAVFCILVDRVVAYGKKEEEERLTGRAETRRTLKQWLAVLNATVLLAIFIAITFLFTCTLILRARDATLEMDGKRYNVDGGKYAVHLACIGNVTHDKNGNKEPTMILEAGERPSEYDFEHWAYSSYEHGVVSRYCYWDRPGYAWSDNAPSPHSAGMSADALSEALARAGETGPWIIVSAGYGSVVSRIFSARHFRDVVGIMLIDPLHEDLLYRIASPGRGFMIWGWGIISPLGIRRIIGALFNGRTREDRVYGRDVDKTGKFLKAKLQENLVAESLTKNELASATTIQARNTPLVIVSSGIKVRTDKDWEKKQRELTHLTRKLLKWEIVEKAEHEVWRLPEGRKIMEQRLYDLVQAAKP